MPTVYRVLSHESFESTPLIFIIRTIHLFGTLKLAIFSLHSSICLVGNYKLTPLEDLIELIIDILQPHIQHFCYL